MHKIVWLASYPKSGNTWTRIIISNLVHDLDSIDINALNTDGISSSRKWFDSNYQFKSSLLSDDEADAFRGDLYNYTANLIQRILYIKTHDAANILEHNLPMFPVNATLGAVYIIRNPLDVAVSMANHNATTLDQSIILMNTPLHSISISKTSLNSQLRQKLGTWSEHVLSWVNRNDIKILVIRYEDLLHDSYNTVTKLAQFTNITHTPKLIEEAIKNSAFENLKTQEQTSNFKEKPTKAASFFREGKSGGWHKHLTTKQTKTIIENHYEVMRKFGYLDNLGNPIF